MIASPCSRPRVTSVHSWYLTSFVILSFLVYPLLTHLQPQTQITQLLYGEYHLFVFCTCFAKGEWRLNFSAIRNELSIHTLAFLRHARDRAHTYKLRVSLLSFPFFVSTVRFAAYEIRSEILISHWTCLPILSVRLVILPIRFELCVHFSIGLSFLPILLRDRFIGFRW